MPGATPPAARILVALAAVGLVVLAACRAEIPDATYHCDVTADCPPGLTCFGGLCVRNAGDAGPLPGLDAGPCDPQDCTALRAECGTIDDGCGTTIDCGACEAPEVCGGGGIDNICDCAARTCAELGAECGTLDDGCGGTLDCGSCDAPATCGGGGTPNQCGCGSEGCMGRCGMLVDGCGGILDCGGCPSGQTCGADGPNRCGTGTCTATSCAAEGKDCGSIGDGCGATLDCGTCTAPATCGGGTPGMQVPNVCGCTPETCGDLGATCGSPTERCGVVLSCGSCTAPETCGGGGTALMCGCTPDACPATAECGSIANSCGGPAISCGACGVRERCVSNACECVPDPTESNNTITSATAAGTLSSASPVITLSYGVHVRDDVDWYAFDVGAVVVSDPTLSFDVRLRDIPPGNDYDLGAWIECGPTRVVPTCTRGTAEASYFDGGCVSHMAGSIEERVTLSTTCASRLYVQVRPASWTPRSCGPYELEVSLTIVSP